MSSIPKTSILFCPQMAIAYRKGLKTQTRRIAGKRQYGEVGDRVVLRTTWATESQYDHLRPSELPSKALIWNYFQFGSDEPPSYIGRLRPGMFLPKHLWFSMPWPRIVGKRVEQVQDISLEDAIAEGVKSIKEYAALWDKINAARGYPLASKPEVVVIDLQPWKDAL